MSTLVEHPVAEHAASEAITSTDVRADLDAIIHSGELALVRRYYRQPFWKVEGIRASLATWLERGRPLENVADHSWKVADACAIVAPRFPDLDLSRTVLIAVLHDKMELYTGDPSPIDRDGTGRTTHAFNGRLAAEKTLRERSVLTGYLGRINGPARAIHAEILNEIFERQTAEAQFVAAVDKLQSLTYVYLKKGPALHPTDFAFTIKYANRAGELFPRLQPYFKGMCQRISDRVATKSWPATIRAKL